MFHSSALLMETASTLHHSYTYTRLCSVMSQKTAMFILITVYLKPHIAFIDFSDFHI